MNENSLMPYEAERRPGPVGECLCSSVRRINRAWLAQQAHQTTRERREGDKIMSEKKREKEEEEEEASAEKFVSFLFLSDKRLAFSDNNKTTTECRGMEVEYGRYIKKLVRQRNLGRGVACSVTCYQVFQCVCVCVCVSVCVRTAL